MSRKFLSIIFSILIFLSLVGCNTSNNVSESSTTSINTEEKIIEETDLVIEETNLVDEVSENENISEEVIVLPSDAEIKETNPIDGTSKHLDELSKLKVHYIDVGQADATLLEYSHEGVDYRILIDAGNWNSSGVVNYLKAHMINHIDILVGTHPHADHIGQMDKILMGIPVSEIWMSGDTTTSQTFQRVVTAVDASGADYHEPRAGEIYDVGPLVIEVINPISLTGNLHEGSVSLRIVYGEVSFLFTGDAEAKTERAMLGRGHNLSADIIQLGHHGSNTSSIPEFLKAVNPKVAIYSAGAVNSYGHPHDEVITRVKNSGITLYGTDVHGTIIVETDGKTYSVSTKKTGEVATKPTTNQTQETVKAPTTTAEIKETSKEKPSANCVDINTASNEEVQKIIHIGPARVEDLLKLRPFRSVDDLSSIKGIGPARIADIKSQGLACVGG